MSLTINKIIDSISKRTISFFNEELGIEVDREDRHLVLDHRLQLKHITTILTIGANNHITVIFSYEKEFMDKIFDAYSQGLDILPEEHLEYIEETASDVINIIVGNATADFQTTDKAINISTPIIISGAKSIARSKTAKFFINDLYTAHGNMSIFCVGPKELFESSDIF